MVLSKVKLGDVFQDLLSWHICLDLSEAIMSTQGCNHAAGAGYDLRWEDITLRGEILEGQN